MPYGTLTTLDTLASTFQTVAEFGEDRLWEQSIQPTLDAHNGIMNDMFDDFCERTTDKQRRYGTTDQMTMTDTDEFGRPDAQKVAPGAIAGFPLRSYQGTIQWTRKYFQNASVAEFAGQVVAIRDADIQRVINEIKRALFNPLNYTFNDYLVDRMSQIPLGVKALLNADSAGIPPGPNGETFDGTTHTHYLGTASLVDANLIAAFETVAEHYAAGEVAIYINRAQETAVRGLASFTKLEQMSLIPSDNTVRVLAPRLQPIALYNRQIGYFNGAEVWVKPWVPANYIVIMIRNQPKPLVIRTRSASSYNLVLVADDEKYPLRAKTFEREFGVGVWNRMAAAVLFVTSGTYSAPTIPN
ncbi:MAG TPA: hypothetical protein VK595_02505 [Vicinamibacterales bacterium]|nr:hypothetical protein [Vicinamibacterales bacterium]